MKKIFTLTVLYVSLIFAAGAQAPLPPAYDILSDTAAYTVLPDTAWQVMADPEGTLTLQQALGSDAFSHTSKKINYRVHVYWIRYRLVNRLPVEADIALPVSAAYVDLYTKADAGKWEHARTGTLVRWSRRNGLKRVPAFSLSIPPGGSLAVYQRVYWDYVAAQPDTMSVYFAPAKKLIRQNYIEDESVLMTSIQDAFSLGLFILSMIISFYFYLVVREKEFLYFSVYLLIVSLQAIPSLSDVFLREYPRFLLFLYIFSNSLMAFMLIHFLRRFLKIFERFPRWDKVLVIFSFLQIVVLVASHLSSALFHTDLASLSHFAFNLSCLVSGILVLITLYLYIGAKGKAVRLVIIALTPVLCLKVLVYAIFVIDRLYAPGFGEPTAHGYVLSFNKAAFFIFILCFLWMVIFFNWVLFLRFSNIRKELAQQSVLDSLKSRFFTNVSHEFRTPLTLIMGPLEDLLRDGDTEKFRSMAPAVYRSSKRLLQLINQLLDLSRLSAGRHDVNTVREDIIPFVKQAVYSFSSLAEKKNITLKMVVDPGLEKQLEGEAHRFYFDDDIMEKIIVNLLSNAFKFTPDGGSVTVSIGLVLKAERYLELKIADTGSGIPGEKLPYIFDRFYQADDSSIRRHEGSGVGLALVKELVELHRGKISVASEPGKQTVFTCLLPLDQKIVSGNAASKEKEAKLNGLPVPGEDSAGIQAGAPRGEAPIILLAEDQEDLRKYIRAKLQDTYTIAEAPNGKMALEKALEMIPDLVVSDVMMPEMDGLALCRSLKTDERTSHIPVILLTARAEDTDKLTGLETGADAYLIKPFNAQELLVRVGNLIEIRNKMRVKFSEKLAVRPREIAVTSQDRLFMEKLLAITEAHIGDAQFSVEQLGREVNMSVSQINRKLKAIINKPASRFIRSVRMDRALTLLRNNMTGTVGEAAYQVGFEDPGYFSKVFKQYYGCLPSEKEKFPPDNTSSR